MTPLLAMFSFFDGMSSGEAPPEVVSNPLYGPALTEAERLRWFSDRTSPVDREKKRRDALRKKRIELGIEEEEEEAIEPVEAADGNELVLRAKARVEAELKKLAAERAEREELEFIMKLLNEED